MGVAIFFVARKERPKSYSAVVEPTPDTGLYVDYVPGFPELTVKRERSTSSNGAVSIGGGRREDLHDHVGHAANSFPRENLRLAFGNEDDVGLNAFVGLG